MPTKTEMLYWLLELAKAREGHADTEDMKVDAAILWLTGLIEREEAHALAKTN